mgnify:CR=1 FL=1
MRHLALTILAALMLLTMASCRRSASEPKEVAEEFYRALIEERWDDYVSLQSNADSMPSDVRRERIDMVREYMAMEREAHGGLVSAQASSEALIAPDYAFVFLTLQWADSTNEEILLPLVRVGEEWRVR